MNYQVLKNFFFCSVIFTSNLLSAQTIEGKLTDINGQDVNYAVLSIKEVKNPESIIEYKIVNTTKFTYKLQNEYESILIEIKAAGFDQLVYTIENPDINQVYTIEFQLVPKEVTSLEEVMIIAKERPYKVKEDTIVYKVDLYKSTEDRKIEDVIKKLPGVEVNSETGEIKFKGKSIQTVTLEGDNLFGLNYSVGTKNINVDMVKEIEAIENYSENPLLKNLENDGKVALNLKLKKNSVDFSGNGDLGSGSFDTDNPAYLINSSLLGITKKFKSFGSFSYNNIGINYSPFDYFTSIPNAEQSLEKSKKAKKVISEIQFSNVAGNNRSYFNNTYFANFNNIVSLGKKLKVKTNFYYLKDEIEGNQTFESTYFTENSTLFTKDNSLSTKEPNLYKADLELKFNSSKKSLLEYNTSISREDIGSSRQINRNDQDLLKSSLNSKDFYFKHHLIFTQKLSARKAIQISLKHSINDIPQQYEIEPSQELNALDINFQNSESRKEFVEAQSLWLGTINKDKYSIIIGGNLSSNRFNSLLLNHSDGAKLQTISNNLRYRQEKIYNQIKYNLNIGNWKISPLFIINYLNQTLEDYTQNTQISSDNLIFEPSLNIVYKITPSSHLATKIEFNQKSNAKNHLFANEVLINNRVVVKNIPNLSLQKNQIYGLYYNNIDLAKHLQINLGINYRRSKGNFLNNYLVDETFTRIEHFFLNRANTLLNTNFQISKYLSFIDSTVKLAVNYSFLKYNNVVNNSDLRLNRSRLQSYQCTWKTAFNIPVNFENTFSISYSKSNSQMEQPIKNTSLENTFKTVFKPFKYWTTSLISDYYLPETNNKENFLFLDFNIEHRPKKGNWSIGFVGKNILNENQFEQIQNTDFVNSRYRYDLLKRHFYIRVGVNF